MHFEQTIAGLPILHLKQIDSTNAYIKRAVQAGENVPKAFAVYADEQTLGRGRLGRTFVSPEGGLYLSVLLPMPSAEAASSVTPLAAVSVCKALREKGVDSGIKWVNDIYVQGRKVCGILCEGVEGGVIIGIGVNIRTPEGGFPQSAGPAGAIDRDDIDRPWLLKNIVENLLRALDHREESLAYYRRYAILTGRQVVCTVVDRTLGGKVLGIDDDFGLIIETEEGKQMTLRTGEVTRVRPAVKAAFFDFDGTMRKGDSIVAYVALARKKRLVSLKHYLSTLFWAGLYAMKIVPSIKAKSEALRFHRTLDSAKKQALDQEFAQLLLTQVYPDARAKWEEMRKEGWVLVLLSASTFNYMQYVAQGLGADALLCTPIEDDGRAHHNCHSQEKVVRAEAYAGEAGVDLQESCAFGDSAGDIYILTRVGHGVAVNPKRGLKKWAAEKQLPILQWK